MDRRWPPPHRGAGMPMDHEDEMLDRLDEAGGSASRRLRPAARGWLAAAGRLVQAQARGERLAAGRQDGDEDEMLDRLDEAGRTVPEAVPDAVLDDGAAVREDGEEVPDIFGD